MLIGNGTNLYVIDTLLTTLTQNDLKTVIEGEYYCSNNRLCGFKDTLFYAERSDKTNTYRYNVESGAKSGPIDLKVKTGKEYAGIDCVGEKYLLVTYYNHDEVLLLDRETPDLKVCFKLKIKPFEYNDYEDDCCFVSEERKQLFIADVK